MKPQKILHEISFFCPAYHDEGNLPVLIPTVHAFLSKISGRFEIIIIEDGSPDATSKVADDLAKQYPEIRVIHHEKNMGYGATLREGFLSARYAYIMYTDGDNQYDVNELLPHLGLLRSGFDALNPYAKEKAVTPRRKVQSAIYNILLSILFFTRFKDANCSLKVYKKEIIDKMQIRSVSAFIDAEMLLKAKKMHYRIAQFPVTHYPRRTGLASGSKSSVIFDTFKEMLKFRFGTL